MATEYVSLSAFSLANCTSYDKPQPLPTVVHIEDPARDVFFDFLIIKPLVINAHQYMHEAKKIMENRTLHVMLVLDDNSSEFIGIIALEDILGTKPVQLQRTYNIELKDLFVKHMMVARDKLVAIDYHNVETAKVGHIIKTLHELNQHFLFVTEKSPEDGSIRLRGIFTDTQINKQLGGATPH